MAETLKPKKPQLKSTQSFLQMYDIRDDTLIMNDGTLRAIIAVSSTNFDLKNQDEQNALIYNYQRFLNSLDFPVQILMQSRRMDISVYLEKLKQLMEKQTNELLRIQTGEYIEFIDRLVEAANVMNKSFYCVIPYSMSIFPPAGGLFSRLLGTGQRQQVSQRLENFEKHKVSLAERVSTVMNNLSGIGLRVVRLNSEQVIELLYNSYNFESAPEINAQMLGNISLTSK
jgi:hypothetical protein